MELGIYCSIYCMNVMSGVIEVKNHTSQEFFPYVDIILVKFMHVKPCETRKG